MKTIRIFLLILIIAGVVLLFTQNVWVPKLVNQILSWQGVYQTNSDTQPSTTTPVLPVKNSATVKGQVILSPVCPVERIPPDPGCAPRPYATTIKIFSVVGNNLIKTVQSDSNGKYVANLPFGNYNFEASGGSVYPRCPSKEVAVKSNIVNVDISCDTGIR